MKLVTGKVPQLIRRMGIRRMNSKRLRGKGGDREREKGREEGKIKMTVSFLSDFDVA